MSNNTIQPIIVLKLGGSVLASEGSLPLAVHEVYRWLREGYRVVAVVSALNGVTDRLLSRARAFCPQPDEGAVAALLATGESTSAPLLSLALDRAGIPATVLNVHQIGLRVEGSVLDAQPVTLDASAVRWALDERAVAVVPGFIGVNEQGGLSLLGRGGSDLTALFIGQQLGARVRLLKDVPGLFESDPAKPGPVPRLFEGLSWDEALALDGRIVQHKAVQFAKDHAQSFEVASLNGGRETVIGSAAATFAERVPARRSATRIGLLGLGTVGLGVLRGVQQLEDRLAVDAIAVRTLRKHVDAGVDLSLLTTDPWRVVESPVELVVETIGGIEPALQLISSALRAGKDVVTANKAVIARHGPELAALAERSGARLRFSAAVGGAVPILENLRRLSRLGRIRRVEGVVNGTCNFILDRLAEGQEFEAALSQAQASGFAEADPGTDLEGIDAAAKLVLIAREALGEELSIEQIDRQGIVGISVDDLREAARHGETIRLVASVERTAVGIVASVKPRRVTLDDPLAQARAEHNRVVVEFEGGALGPVVLHGKGAGRYPTAEAVIGDVLELLRERADANGSTPVVDVQL
ncbi:MAG: homoserine dehydrogenase, partial [Phycisphaerales bacterium]